MVGNIYLIEILALPHPHLVIADLGQEVWVVPAFDPEGFQVKLDALSYEQLGYPPDHIHVQIDNAEHVSFTKGMTGKVANWFIARSYPLSKRLAAPSRLIGHMHEPAVDMVASALLELVRAQPARFPKTLRNALVARDTGSEKGGEESD